MEEEEEEELERVEEEDEKMMEDLPALPTAPTFWPLQQCYWQYSRTCGKQIKGLAFYIRIYLFIYMD